MKLPPPSDRTVIVLAPANLKCARLGRTGLATENEIAASQGFVEVNGAGAARAGAFHSPGSTLRCFRRYRLGHFRHNSLLRGNLLPEHNSGNQAAEAPR